MYLHIHNDNHSLFVDDGFKLQVPKVDALIDTKNTGSRSTRSAREDFAQHKELERRDWIQIGGNQWRKYPRDKRQYIKCYSISHAPR